VSLILKFCLPKGKPVLQLTTILVWFSIKPKFEDCNSDWGAMVQVVTAQKKFEDCNSDWGAMVQVVTAQKSMGLTSSDDWAGAGPGAAQCSHHWLAAGCRARALHMGNRTAVHRGGGKGDWSRSGRSGRVGSQARRDVRVAR
jgi:predicted lipoprotein with Yx(FWY)xxD motif